MIRTLSGMFVYQDWKIFLQQPKIVMLKATMYDMRPWPARGSVRHYSKEPVCKPEQGQALTRHQDLTK